ncbi:hypothetical protein DFH09DRAFT_1315343 [Mycena vulgaris]|nr:hypothetical protein DFH09DRAFT_1315343 [Mycena vulgaris]
MRHHRAAAEWDRRCWAFLDMNESQLFVRYKGDLARRAPREKDRQLLVEYPVVIAELLRLPKSTASSFFTSSSNERHSGNQSPTTTSCHSVARLIFAHLRRLLPLPSSEPAHLATQL